MHEPETETPINRSGPLLAVFAALCALTGLSFWIANSHLMENQLVGWTAMIAVSIVKASMVMMFFMHLWWERAWKYAITIPSLALAVVLVILLVPDIGFRTRSYSKQRWSNAPVPQNDVDVEDRSK